MTAGDSSLDEGWGHPPGNGGLVTDRQAWGRARGWGSVRWPFKCQRHELFPWQALPLLCQMSNAHGAWSYKICCLLSQIIWTFWHRVDGRFVLCFHASKFWILCLSRENAATNSRQNWLQPFSIWFIHNMTLQSSNEQFVALTRSNKKGDSFIRLIHIIMENFDNTASC